VVVVEIFVVIDDSWCMLIVMVEMFGVVVTDMIVTAGIVMVKLIDVRS